MMKRPVALEPLLLLLEAHDIESGFQAISENRHKVTVEVAAFIGSRNRLKLARGAGWRRKWSQQLENQSSSLSPRRQPCPFFQKNDHDRR
jgi:hypothetical protein